MARGSQELHKAVKNGRKSPGGGGVYVGEGGRTRAKTTLEQKWQNG